MKVYYDKDADLSIIRDKKVAIIGAGLSFIDFTIDEVINPKLRTLNAKPAKSKKAKVK